MSNKVILFTNFGSIIMELDRENTPHTAQNFLNYAQEGFYNGSIFHRVINGFVIQGGGYESGMVFKKVGNPIQNEADKAIPNLRGTVAMARNSKPHSATSQFFVNLVDNNFLNFSDYTDVGWGYCVFAKISAGMDVITTISKVNTISMNGHKNVPIADVMIERVNIEA